MTRRNRKDDPGDGCQLDPDVGPRSTVMRYRVRQDKSIDPESGIVVLETLPLGERFHNAGDMHFGVDGMLYISLGDAGHRPNSQDRSHLFGTMLRITDDGKIPMDNPYTGSDTAPCKDGVKLPNNMICQEIFAYGLRNPFRFTMDPHSNSKVRFYINDVGGRTWEETNMGGTDFAGYVRFLSSCLTFMHSSCFLNNTTQCQLWMARFRGSLQIWFQNQLPVRQSSGL